MLRTAALVITLALAATGCIGGDDDDDEGVTKEDFIEQVIHTAAQTVMNRLVGDYSIDEVLTEKRGEIASKARDATQEILNQYQCGVAIIDLQLQRVTPPAKVKPAFDEVNSAIQQRDKLISEAKKESEKLLPAAEAKKDEGAHAPETHGMPGMSELFKSDGKDEKK